MIYRFMSALNSTSTYRNRCIWGGKVPRFGGACACGGTELWDLKLPQIVNKKAKFYFTEKGWKIFAKQMIVHARENGQILKVIRRKNPKKSQIVYKDEYQVAIMPDKRNKNTR